MNSLSFLSSRCARRARSANSCSSIHTLTHSVALPSISRAHKKMPPTLGDAGGQVVLPRERGSAVAQRPAARRSRRRENPARVALGRSDRRRSFPAVRASPAAHHRSQVLRTASGLKRVEGEGIEPASDRLMRPTGLPAASPPCDLMPASPRRELRMCNYNPVGTHPGARAAGTGAAPSEFRRASIGTRPRS